MNSTHRRRKPSNYSCTLTRAAATLGKPAHLAARGPLGAARGSCVTGASAVIAPVASAVDPAPALAPAAGTGPAVGEAAPTEPVAADERVQITVPAGEVVESQGGNVVLQMAGGALVLAGAGAMVLRVRRARSA